MAFTNIKTYAKEQQMSKPNYKVLTKETATIAEIYSILSRASDNTFYLKYVTRGQKIARHMIFKVCGSDDRSGESLPIHRVVEDINNEVLTVWDANRNDYRRIDFRTTQILLIDQVEYTVTK